MKGRILTIDDEPRMGPLLERTLGREGFEVEPFVDPEAALRRLREEHFDVLVTDLRMPGIDGLEVLRRARSIRPGCEVVVMTAHATVGSARQALKRGAIDYLTKPFSIERELLPLILNVLAAEAPDDGRDGGETAAATSAYGSSGTHARAAVRPDDGPIGSSRAMRDAVERSRKVARAATPVLLLGESGSGKEVFADLVHRLSPRSDRPLLRVNCAALPESLLESELFGHARGAFTGASREREGIFTAADGGTLFLDEIGEMAPSVQPKLLRVLQSGDVQRVGEAGRTRRVDVRIVAATNRDLRKAVSLGSFREDLYYRLAVVPISIPPLRDRLEDLPDLIDHFLGRLGTDARFSDEALAAMRRYDWPGNVRELANAVEHAVVLGSGPALGVDDLPAALQESEHRNVPGETATLAVEDVVDDGTLEQIEQRTILQALERTHCNRTEAARLLGVTRRTLGYRIRKYDLEGTIESLRTSLQEGIGPERPGVQRVNPRADYAQRG